MIVLKDGTSVFNAPLPPMLTIIDDDGHQKFYTDILPIIESKHVPIASAIIGKNIGVASTYMTWAQVEEAYSKGAEILNHTYSHLGETEDTRTAEEIYMDYTKNERLMYSHGIVTGADILVYPGGSANLATAQTASHLFARGAFKASGNALNEIGADIYSIQRYRIGTDYAYDVDVFKGLIDKITHGWMVWMVHTSGSAWTADSPAILSSAIDYAKSKGVAIVTAKYGISKLYDGN